MGRRKSAGQLTVNQLAIAVGARDDRSRHRATHGRAERSHDSQLAKPKPPTIPKSRHARSHSVKNGAHKLP